MKNWLIGVAMTVLPASVTGQSAGVAVPPNNDPKTEPTEEGILIGDDCRKELYQKDNIGAARVAREWNVAANNDGGVGGLIDDAYYENGVGKEYVDGIKNGRIPLPSNDPNYVDQYIEANHFLESGDYKIRNSARINGIPQENISYDDASLTIKTDSGAFLFISDKVEEDIKGAVALAGGKFDKIIEDAAGCTFIPTSIVTSKIQDENQGKMH